MYRVILDICSECAGDIEENERFYNINGNLFHEQCINGLSARYLFELLGIKPNAELQEMIDAEEFNTTILKHLGIKPEVMTWD